VWILLVVAALGVVVASIPLGTITIPWWVLFIWIAALVGIGVPYRLESRRYARYVQALESRRTAATKAVVDAEGDLERDVTDVWVRPRIREEINRRAGWKLRTAIEPVDYQGLATDDPRHTIGTAARERLEQFLRHKSSGSIGLSGPRGAGKSSLIRVSCPDGDLSSEGLFGVIVTAPVEFEAREFVLRLFGRLCAAVLGREGVEEARRMQSSGMLVRHWRAIAMCAPVAAVAAATAIVLVAEDVLEGYLVWAAAIVVAGLALPSAFISNRRRQYVREESPGRAAFSPRLRRLARDRLRSIWFQQSFTTGWSGAVKLPIGVEGGIEGTQELSRLQMSLPDVVGEIEFLVAEVVSENRRVRIGIDELDKLSDTDKARQFLNEMKVLFGISSCFWLVSISEDAMSSFERRGLPVRDEFDSSFTDVIRVSPQSAAGTIELLRRRVVGVPQPFMLLCHCLAGGLPRDVLRIAWDIVTYANEHGTARLAEVCEELVARHVTAKFEATLVSTQALAQTTPLHEFQAWLLDIRRQPVTAPQLLALCDDAPERLRPILVAEDRSEARELLAYCLFAATCLEFFGGLAVDPEVTPEAWTGQLAIGDALGAAQQAFSVHPQAAWLATSAVRERLDLRPVPYPRPPSNGARAPSAPAVAGA
jgi:hypothetical protein